MARHLTALSLAALFVGLGSGITLHGSHLPWVAVVDGWLHSVGRIWISSLQLTVVPLILTQVVVAVMGTERLGSLGVRSLLLFFIMLLAAGGFALLVASPLVALYNPDPELVAALRASVSPGDGGESGLGSPAGLLDFIPAGLRAFFLGEHPIPLLLGSAALALMARRLTGPRRSRTERFFQQFSSVTMRVVGWILLLTPLGVLALTFGLAQSAGGGALSLLIVFVLIISGTTILFTLLLYPVTAALGKISVRAFAWGVAPAQIVAASTRSSLAALPALVEGGADRLGLPAAGTGFVIPLGVATVKFSRMITTIVTLLFLARAFDLPLGAPRVLLFFGTVLLLSFVVAGLPGRGPEVSLFPPYVAAGIPLDGVVLLEAVDAIPDIFKTILNVTGIMSAATVLTPPPGSGAEP